MCHRLLIIACSIFLFNCGPRIHKISSHFDPRSSSTIPDYTLLKYWAAHPDKKDAADSIPLKSGLTDDQATAGADVFFIYPTIYTQRTEGSKWNADINNEALNKRIQETTILNQASIFNGSCRVYSPYYRQAHLYAFYAEDPQDGKKALDIAYEDVRSAFRYYLTHHNQGRPIVIASHSQGSYHAIELLKEFFGGKDLQKQLVMAYLPGRAIPENTFRKIRPCTGAEDTGVWASWNTFAKGFFPDNYEKYYTEALSTNPLLWNSSEDYAPKELNVGGVGFKFTFVPNIVDAQNHQHVLWVNKPNVQGKFFIRTKVWHRADMNLYWMNIRENVKVRVEEFQNLNTSK